MRRSAELAVALADCAENAARVLGSSKFRLRPTSIFGLGEDASKKLVASRGYEEPAREVCASKATEDSVADSLGAQLELLTTMKDMASVFDSMPNDESTVHLRPEDDASLEDLVSSLLRALKTDQGRSEFRRLAAPATSQTLADPPEAQIAPRAFVPRPKGDSNAADNVATTTTIGNARAVAELLAADSRLHRDG